MRLNWFFLSLAVSFMSYSAFAQDYYVSPRGNDRGPGTEAKPWKTLEYAFQKLQESKGESRLVVAGGEYILGSPLVLQNIRGNIVTVEAAPGASPVIRGDRKILRFRPWKGNILRADLKAAGVKDLGNACTRKGLLDLFWKGERQRLARYPNDGFLFSGDARGMTKADDISFKEGIFGYKEDRISSWEKEKDGWIYGYYRWDWSDQYQKIKDIDTGTKTVTLEEPWHYYGFKSGFRFYGINLLCELDSPGEYYVDRDKGVLYWFPPEGYSAGDEVSVSCYDGDFMLQIIGCQDVTVSGLTFKGGRGNAMLVDKSERVSLDRIGVSCFGGDALHITSSEGIKVDGCIFKTLGHSGIQATGGDRKTLKEAGYSITNTIIKDFSLFKHTYEPAVHFVGCGLKVANCEFAGSSSSAMRIDGSCALVEYNHFHDLVKESDDQGGIDMFFNYGYRGVVIRYNFWENILGGSLHGAAGVRFDDMISGQLVYGNIFRNVGALHFGAVQIHGGKDNVVDNNVFYKCHVGVSFSPWTQKSWDSQLASEQVRMQLHEDIDIDGPLYRERYPALNEDIHGNLNRNFIKNNLAVGCPKMFNNEQGYNVLQNNSALFMGESAESIKPLEYFLSPEVLAAFGLQPIPYRNIGPYGRGVTL